MQKIAIVYASVHHKNTQKLIMEIYKEVGFDFFTLAQAKEIDFSNYEKIGFASGIYMGKLHQSIYRFIEANQNALPRQAFVLCTSGVGKGHYAKKFASYLKKCSFDVVGQFECKGFDTYGFLHLFGGLAKGHPDANDVEKGVAFLKRLV